MFIIIFIIFYVYYRIIYTLQLLYLNNVIFVVIKCGG